MTEIIKGRKMAEITGANTPVKQIEILKREGFVFWLDAADKPRMYDGQLPKQAVKKEKQPINDTGFKLPDAAKTQH